MSRMLALLNRLKAEANCSMLSESQQRALAEVSALLRYPERVNLWGPRGCGKTMTAWVAGRLLDATVYPSPRAFHQAGGSGGGRVVVDNVPDDERALRSVLAELQLMGVTGAVLITGESNRLGLPKVVLPHPTLRDIDVVYRNLGLLGLYAPSPPGEGNLWAIVQSVL